MNRRTIEIAFVAVVAILVVSVAASTLDSTTSGGGGSSGGGNGTSILPQRQVNVSAPDVGFSIPREPMIVLIGGALLLTIWYALENPREVVAFMLAASVLFAALLLLLLVLGELFGNPSGSGNGGTIAGDSSGGRIDTGTGGAVFGSQTVQLLAVLVFGVVFVGVMLTLSDRESVERPEESAPEPTEITQVARAAGRAADRIEADAAVDNEVYRAWRDMTESLDVSNPDSSTPREFADAAIEAGMDPDDVRELTDVFEEVRYGDEDPTEEREERAVGALRRIESTYGDDAGA